MQATAYPEFLENAWLRKATAVTRLTEHEAALEALRPAVRELSDLFTTERPQKGFHDYAADPKLLTAYGLFFFPQSFVKCDSALRSLHALGRLRPAPSAQPLRILDLGCASGPCGFAAALFLAQSTGRKVILTAFDHSTNALAELARLAREVPELSGVITVETRAGDMRRAGEALKELPAQDLVIVGFALNEIAVAMDAAARLAWVKSLRPLVAESGTLLILEPALRETAEPLRRLRDALLAGPDLYATGPDVAPTPCPFLAAKSPYWDHEARDWEIPASLEFLNRKLHRDLRALKFAPLSLSPTRPESPEQPTFRLITPPDLQKAGIIFTAVGPDGLFSKFTIPTRSLSKSESKEITRKLSRGDYITIDNIPPGEKIGVITIPDSSAIKVL